MKLSFFLLVLVLVKKKKGTKRSNSYSPRAMPIYIQYELGDMQVALAMYNLLDTTFVFSG